MTAFDVSGDPAQLRVYVNERGVNVPRDASALDAVRAHDAAEADRVAAGARAITDSRGLPVAADAPVHGGAIFRTIAARPTGGASAGTSPTDE